MALIFPLVSAQFTISGTVIMIACCVQLGETPLHFACKFGFVEMVAVLISHPGTDKQPKNTSGLAPKDVCYHALCGFYVILSSYV